MANFIKILMGSKSKSDCCNIEIKEVEKEEEACCGGDPSCC